MADVTRKLSDPLWVPLLSHYDPDGRLDLDRMSEQVAFLRPNVRQFLLGGSTADGWDLDDAAFEDLVRLAEVPGLFGNRNKLLFGLLRPTTEEVVERASILTKALHRSGRIVADVVGVAVCPPIDAKASQAGIRDHYEAVFAATALPVALYQLPQVTRCMLEPDTVRALAKSPRVTMFKDSSGNDAVAKSGAVKGIIALRGAEGHYAEALAPAGPYDGWLLSSGNSFPMALREMADALLRGEKEKGEELSNRISQAVEGLFESVAGLKFGNIFSNANRAADHLLAWGRNWQNAPPLRAHGGIFIPAETLADVERVLSETQFMPNLGYLKQRSSH
jgi:dihydrodipicolinate synthase/N-acetylneuraminate lyase